MKHATPSIKEFLDRTLERYHRHELLSSDPLEFVHRERDAQEQEIAALVAALLAYGNVNQIRRSVALALELIRAWKGGLKPSVESLSSDEGLMSARAHFEGFYHRFNVGDDLLILLGLISRSWLKHGSVGAHFMSHHSKEAETISGSLDAFLDDWLAWTEVLPLRSASFRYLITRPKDGSCCKRWCMLLRWMGRKDALDPGLWQTGGVLLGGTQGLDPSQLVMPLDTHTGRISQYIGLTRRKTLHWKAALEITEKLRRLDPQDPVKYDFALSRLGILDLCQRKFRQEICRSCDLVSVCQFARKNLRKS